MKTYIKEVVCPRLVIEQDEGAESPRKESNMGYFFTKESRYSSPDGTEHALYKIMIEAGDEAENLEEHIKIMKTKALRLFKESGDEDLHIMDIYPVYRYEHGGVVYKRGRVDGFDYSNCGFYIVTAQGISGEIHTQESIESRIDAELDRYSSWCNGKVYFFALYDEDGDFEDSCGGFYELDEIKEYLGDDWRDEDMSQYLSL